MALFSFIKDAGEKVFETGKPTEEENKSKEIKLVNALAANKLELLHIKIDVNNDKATIYGEVASQVIKEKAILVVGNTLGIATVDDKMTIKVIFLEVVVMAKFYTIEKGDTLGKVAKQFYGNAVKYPFIFKANEPMLKHPDKIYPGQVLRIPELKE